MKVSVNITKKEYGFIDPNTGEEFTSAEFNKRHNQFGLGGLGVILSGGQIKTEEGANS